MSLAAPGAKQVYKVSVRTMDERGAGTDADVTIKLVGAQASTAELKLESSANNFERNQVMQHAEHSCGACGGVVSPYHAID